MDHDLLAATETFLDSSVEDSELVLSGWSVIRRDRRSYGGGVLLASKQGITPIRVSEFETTNGEDLWVKFSYKKSSVYVCVVYIPPSATDSVYFDWFCKVESFINDLKGTVLIIGDINLNSASKNVCNYYSYFLSFCSMSDRNNVYNTFGGKLDVVLLKGSNCTVQVNSADSGGIVNVDSYHPPLDIELNIFSNTCSENIIPSNFDLTSDWNFNKANFSLLYEMMSTVDWDCVFNASDVQSATAQFYKVLYNIFDLCVPKKSRQASNRKRYPVWFSHDIIKDINRKIKFHKEWKRYNDLNIYTAFSTLRSDLKRRIETAYNAYIENIENGIKKNPKNFWNHISSLRSKGGFEPTVTYKDCSFSGSAAADAFANYFASVFLPNSPILDFNNLSNSPLSCDGHINITHFTLSQVEAGINKLKPLSSVGPDKVPSYILKGCKKIIAPVLSYIYNLALKTGIYPEQWKISKVTPIPKTSNKTLVEEYRPIAVLSCAAKLFENIAHKEIYAQVNTRLCEEQHGFRPGRSVETNLLSLVDYISHNMDKGQQVDVLYLDFKKAFDTVDNDILLNKLYSMGFTPKLLKFFADYLSNRKQYVSHGSFISKSYHTCSGVSQGSVLGPLLFLIMVNDLIQVVKYAKCLLYADDLKLVQKINKDVTPEHLQSDIDRIYKWSVDNKMMFNAGKCYVMTFSRKLQPTHATYTLAGVEIKRVSIITDLGVTFDCGLTFHAHMSALASESYRRLGFVLRNARDFNNPIVIKLLFNCLVRSKLEFAAAVWNPHESTYLLGSRAQSPLCRMRAAINSLIETVPECDIFNDTLRVIMSNCLMFCENHVC